MHCPNCGQDNPADARFCFSCGRPFEEASAREERKVVTVLFADLVGFTSRAEQMDPEDVRALLAPYHQRLRGELERFGGTVEKFIGDAVVALFGAPVAHEDDPERAVRAALAIRDWVREEEAELQLRIAVNTGEALIALGARPEAGEGMASGDVVNTTARLQSAAPVNGVLVGEATWRSTRDRIEYAEHEPVSAKGKTEPITVWEAVQAKSRLGMDLEQRVLTPLVGRERELAALSDAFDRAVGQREPQLVTLVGVPGIGKSRLVAELFQRIEEMTDLVWWRQGRTLPYGSGVSFWAVGEIVKAQAGINENDPPKVAAGKLRVSVEEVVEMDQRDWVRRHVETLLGLSDDAALDRQEAFAAWRTYFEGLAEQHPLVLVVEDLHWADDGLLDFVDHLADWASGVPLLVLASARPELLDRRPDWGGGKLNSTTLALSPLDDADAARVISAVLDRTLMPAETQAALLEQAGGNPLYAEQFARLFLERGDLAVPENVQGIIAGRIDGLAEDEKRLLQDAAVLGKVFWSGGVGGDDGDATLHALERKGFIRRERRSAVAGETEYAFRHVLVREVAYGQIPRAARADRHIASLEWIESLGRADDHAELIAHHYAAALELREAAGGEASDDFRVRARLAFRRAGDRAAALNAFAPAADHYAAALALWPVEDADHARVQYELGHAQFTSGRTDGRELVAAAEELLAVDALAAATAFSVAGEAAWHRGDTDETDSLLDRALGLVEPLPDSEAKAWILSRVSRRAMLSARRKSAIEYGQRAVELATVLDLPEVRAHALNNMGAAQQGKPEAIPLLEESVELSSRLNSPEEARGHHNLGVCWYMLGDVRKALAELEAAVSSGERFGLAPLVRFSRTQVPGYYFRVGRWDDAIELANAVIAVGGRDESTSIARAWVRTLRGDLKEAVEDVERALEAARRAGDPQSMYPCLGVTAFVQAEAGNRERARALLTELADQWSQTEVAYGAPADMGIAWLDILGPESWRACYDRGDSEPTVWREAVRALVDEDYARAIEVYEATGAVTDVAAAQLYAARKLVESGRRAEADIYLQPALAFYRSVRATLRVRQGEALLAATA